MPEPTAPVIHPLVKVTFVEDAAEKVGDDWKGPRDQFYKGRSYDLPEPTAHYWMNRKVAVLACDAPKSPAGAGGESTGSGEGGSTGGGKGSQGGGETTGPALEILTIARLGEVAAAEGIDLGKATVKADIIQVIRNARTLKAATGGG